jgi:hypothetical protein
MTEKPASNNVSILSFYYLPNPIAHDTENGIIQGREESHLQWSRLVVSAA